MKHSSTDSSDRDCTIDSLEIPDDESTFAGLDGEPVEAPPLSARVRSDVARLLIEGECTHRRVATALGLHPRTLQRRLRKEGASFEAIKDSVRRDVAMHYLQQPDMPLVRLTELLGYSETSVLSRSCHRWFAASPRTLRKLSVLG